LQTIEDIDAIRSDAIPLDVSCFLTVLMKTAKHLLECVGTGTGTTVVLVCRRVCRALDGGICMNMYVSLLLVRNSPQVERRDSFFSVLSCRDVSAPWSEVEFFVRAMKREKECHPPTTARSSSISHPQNLPPQPHPPPLRIRYYLRSLLLTVKKENGSRRTRRRLLFPTNQESGDTVFLAGRQLGDEEPNNLPRH